MLSEGRNLFAGTPILAAVDKEHKGIPEDNIKVAQIVFDMDAGATVSYALDLLPKT